MTGRLSGKVALVTGAGRGMGRSHAVTMAREGADVIVLDVCAPLEGLHYELSSPEDLKETARLVEAQDRRVVQVVRDIRDLEGMKADVAAAVGELGRLDAVVTNAAIATTTPWDQVTPQMWHNEIEVNLTGTWNTVVATVPHLVEAGGGSLILVSSVAGVKALPFLAPYVASKHGVTGLAKALAIELAEQKIRVNSLAPGSVDTPMQGGRAAVQERFGDMFAEHPLWQNKFSNMFGIPYMEPVDLSNAVVYLASDESRYVTAQSLAVDAGFSHF
ncbi:mycofactocin-coupled SDR family oxidoreductase [Pseudonocardia ailaonensis]|uniref:Mycofactocin-coupled SDR family oxidoreductase n=1 Tax=Pseudonocardia ailaonensis TaxID=367279 RepID=A0ABN2NGX0_9PSEU